MVLLIQRICDELDAALAGGTRCLVHCAAGMSRSASLCAAYLVRSEGVTAAEAVKRVREKRQSVNPNPGFRDQLRRWERECAKARKR